MQNEMTVGHRHVKHMIGQEIQTFLVTKAQARK
jgi:hypothetical protein